MVDHGDKDEMEVEDTIPASPTGSVDSVELEAQDGGQSQGGEEMPGDDVAGSALEENIRRKGQNSYYYAHSKRISKLTFALSKQGCSSEQPAYGF